MLWKEIFIETSWKMTWLGRVIIALLVICSFLPGAIIYWEYHERVENQTPGVRHLTQQEARTLYLEGPMNAWVRTVGTIVGCLTLLGVAVRGANSIGGERDRQTLDALLTTPMSTNHILFAKWVGSVLSMRWAGVWLGSLWLAGIVTGGLHLLALPLLVIAWFIYAAVYALVGIWFSIVSKTTGRATIWALLTGVFIGGLHWCLWSLCCLAPWFMAGSGGMDADYLPHFMAGQTPPAVLAIFAFHGEEFQSGGMDRWDTLIAFCLFGLACWTAAALFFATFPVTRFKEMTNRGQVAPDYSRRSLDPRFEEAGEPPDQNPFRIQ
jgi:ABC-type transport system involved in multi-copper enzyme maturation permease subunit